MQKSLYVSTNFRKMQTGLPAGTSWVELFSWREKIHKHEFPTKRPLILTWHPKLLNLTALVVFIATLRIKSPYCGAIFKLLFKAQRVVILGSGNSIDLPGEKLAYSHMYWLLTRPKLLSVKS